MQYPTLDRYGVTGTQNAPCHDLNKNRCPLLLKIATFSLKGVRKTLPVCPPQSLRTSAVTKLEIIFARTTLEGVLPYKFRRNRLPDSLRSEAIIKKAETSRQGSGSACRTVGYLNITPCFLQIHRKVSIPIFRLRRHLANCSSQSVG